MVLIRRTRGAAPSAWEAGPGSHGVAAGAAGWRCEVPVTRGNAAFALLFGRSRRAAGHTMLAIPPNPAFTMPALRHWPALAIATALGSLLAAPGHAAPAPWYYWRSLVDGARVCAQTSPGQGWERDSAAHEGPGCQPRRKVLVIPMR